MIKMKTTEEIFKDIFSETSSIYFMNAWLWNKNKHNQKWYSEDEITEAIKKVQNSNKLFNDFEGDLRKNLFGDEK